MPELENFNHAYQALIEALDYPDSPESRDAIHQHARELTWGLNEIWPQANDPDTMKTLADKFPDAFGRLAKKFTQMNSPEIDPGLMEFNRTCISILKNMRMALQDAHLPRSEASLQRMKEVIDRLEVAMVMAAAKAEPGSPEPA